MGEEYAEVTAKDFVNGLKHAADKKSEALYLAETSVKGLSDYLSGNSKGFSTVGEGSWWLYSWVYLEPARTILEL